MNGTTADLTALIKRQKEYLATGSTRPLAFRQQMLRRFMQAIQNQEAQNTQAQAADICKPDFETYASQIGILLSEIRFMLRNVKKWIKPLRVKASLFNFPSRDYFYPEPLGVSLVIGARNYPSFLVAGYWGHCG